MLTIGQSGGFLGRILGPLKTGLPLMKNVSKLRKAFGNGSSANIKLSKTQLHKIGQSGGFLGRILGPLKTGLPLMKNVKPLAKSV